ncbi:MAG: alpha/beta hydrolase [Methylophilaceae bacterium]
MTQTLEKIEIETSSHVRSSVIWLHGLGADGHDFEAVVRQLEIPNTRFILPHAPYRAITLNNGYEMRAWYDLFGLELGSQQDETGICATETVIAELINQEIVRGIKADQIILAGFSQGGAIALHTALRYPEKLAGVLALSTYLPLQPTLEKEMHAANADTPIFMAHGTFDSVITLDRCKVSKHALEAHGYTLEWHEYPMAHSVCIEELADIRHFLLKILTLKKY